MLEAIRKRSASIAIKILFALLILSFVSWGIGDLLSGRANVQFVAEVGDVEITPQELSNAYGRDVNQMEALFRTRIDREQARAMGLLQASLSRLVGDTLYDLEANSLGVTASDSAIRTNIRNDNSFMDQSGKFSPMQFEQVLLANGVNEQGYVARLRGKMARNQIGSSIEIGAVAPEPLVDAIYRHRQEKRVAQTAFVADSAMDGIGEPGNDELTQFHADNPDQFTAPEYREITVLNLLAKDLEDEVSVTEEEIADHYEQRQDEFDRPELRKIRQIVVPEESKAKEIHKLITDGGDFASVAKEEAGLDEQTIDVGEVSKTMLLTELADAAFALPKGRMSQPVQSPLGWHVLLVDDITYAYKQPVEEASKILSADIRREKSIDALFDLANRLDDSLGGGATLEETAQEHNIKLQKIDAIDGRGLDIAGNSVADLPAGGKFIRTAFVTPETETSLMTEAGSDGYFILRVDGVTPSAVQPLDEVRQKAIAAWKADRRDAKAKEIAEGLVERIGGGAKLADIAAEIGSETKTTEPFTRRSVDPDAGLPPQVVQDLFKAKSGDAVSGRRGNGYVVAHLTKIEPANPGTDSKGVEAVENDLSNSLRNDIQNQYAAALRNRFPVSVNQRAIDELF
ncbi:MAG: SurA N-terminal domain-containing protein [Rhodospirillales bacterium]|nr:SurA N-terminal domain-containing protein [Rhodospirillales bacterium]